MAKRSKSPLKAERSQARRFISGLPSGRKHDSLVALTSDSFGLLVPHTRKRPHAPIWPWGYLELCSSLQQRSRTVTGRYPSNGAVRQHGIRHFFEAGDVRTFHVVDIAIWFAAVFDTLLVDFRHYLDKLPANLLFRP